MRRIRSTGTGPERLLTAALAARGRRFEPQGRPPVGRPDHSVRLGSREEFWAARPATPVDRDPRQTEALWTVGWRVLRLGECELREDADVGAVRATTDGEDGNSRPIEANR